MLTTIQTKGTYTCEILSEANFDGAVECIASTFLMGEPMTKILKIADRDFYTFAEVFLKKAILDGLSIVARDENSGKIVGSLICEDFITEMPEGIETISDSFAPIFHLLGSLGENYKANNEVKQGDLYHLFMGGVLKEYAGKGIIQHMTYRAEGLAVLKGFKGAVGEVTGPISQHVYINQLGYKELGVINYSDFIYEGEHIFNNITDCTSCKFIYKAL